MSQHADYVNRLAAARTVTARLEGGKVIRNILIADLVEKLDIQLVVEGRVYGRALEQPSLVFSPRVQLYYPNKKTWSPLFGKTRVFTATSKMRAPSWSLPAGPPKLGGTCVVSSLPRLVKDPGAFVCYGCYAISGDYQYESTMLFQTIHRAWTERALLDAGVPFVQQLDAALSAFIAKPRFAAVVTKSRGKACVTRVSMNSRYFRIHDSGDVAWAGPNYLQAWKDVARRNRTVKFWMPVRDWALPNPPAFHDRPANFVCRPSALHVGDAPPDAVGLGLDAGTTVDFDIGAAQYQCPAYNSPGALDHSCESARCRRCWTRPQLTINYYPHGGITKTNPRLDLFTLLDQYARSNPPAEHFHAWLASRAPTETLDEVQWMDYLTAEGLDGDEAVEFLLGNAEWLA